jgi:hypothetical protein
MCCVTHRVCDIVGFFVDVAKTSHLRVLCSVVRGTAPVPRSHRTVHGADVRTFSCAGWAVGGLWVTAPKREL